MSSSSHFDRELYQRERSVDCERPSLNLRALVSEEVVGCRAVICLVVFQARPHIVSRVSKSAHFIHYFFIYHEFLVKVLQNLLLLFNFLQFINRCNNIWVLRAMQLPALSERIFADSFMGLFLRCLCELIEHTVVKVTVVIKLVVFIDLFHTHAKLDDHVLVEDEFLYRLRQDVDRLEVRFSSVKRSQYDWFRRKVTKHRVLGRVKVSVCKIEGLVHKRVKLLPIITLGVDELLFDYQLFSIIENVH